MISVAFNQLLHHGHDPHEATWKVLFCKNAGTIIGQSWTVLDENGFEPGKGKILILFEGSGLEIAVRSKHT